MADGFEVAKALLATAPYVAAIAVCLVVQAAHQPPPEGDEEMQEGHKKSAASIDTGVILAGLKYLLGIFLVLAYAWACDRSGTSLGLENRSKRFEPAVAAPSPISGVARRSGIQVFRLY